MLSSAERCDLKVQADSIARTKRQRGASFLIRSWKSISHIELLNLSLEVSLAKSRPIFEVKFVVLDSSGLLKSWLDDQNVFEDGNLRISELLRLAK